MLASSLGKAVFLCLKKEREKTIANLKFAYGDSIGTTEIAKIAEAVFRNIAMVFIDVLLLPKLFAADLEGIHNGFGEVKKRVDAILQKGNGIIVITGHLGNWELLAATFTKAGYEGGVMAKRIYYPPFNNLLVKNRAACKLRTFYRDTSVREIVKVFRNNQVLGVLADQDIDSVDGIFVDFFGKPAFTPIGPAKMSLASGAPILPVFCIREGWNYRFYLEDPIFPDSSEDKEAEIRRITRAWSRSVEKYIKRYPEQWVWMHERWKTKPKQPVTSGK